MLLGIMRKQAKSWLIKFLIGIIALVFIFYFGYSFRSEKGIKMAYVNGELISGLEYQKAFKENIEALQRQYRDAWNDSMIKALDLQNRTLENLINQKLISQEAERLGLDVTEREIKDAIVNYPAFQIDGQFSINRYRTVLDSNRMNSEDFEEGMAKQLLFLKLRQFLFAFMEVTEQEALDYYTFENERIRINFVQFIPDNFKKSIEVDQAELNKFFDSRRHEYEIPEKIKFSYIEIDPDSFQEKITITDRQIEDYYEFGIDAFSQPKQVRARHILFKLSQDASPEQDETVKQKANKVLEEARKETNFDALARKYSEGPTKETGGDLGYFSEGQMVDTFEEAAFKLKAGEISDLVRTQFGYHIIKVEDIKEEHTKDLNEVRDQIMDILIRNAKNDLAQEKALSLLDHMPYDTDLVNYSEQNHLEVKYLDYFSQTEPIPGIGNDDKLLQILFSLEGREASQPFELNDKMYIFQIADKKEAYLPDLKEVSGRVKDNFISFLSVRKAREAAELYLEELRNGKDWIQLSKEKGMKSEKTDFFSRNNPVPGIGYISGIQDIVFNLNEKDRYPEKVFENEKGVFVIRWDTEEGIDMEEYEKEKQKYRFSLMEKKHMYAFENWVQSLRVNSDIRIITPFQNK